MAKHAAVSGVAGDIDRPLRCRCEHCTRARVSLCVLMPFLRERNAPRRGGFDSIQRVLCLYVASIPQPPTYTSCVLVVVLWRGAAAHRSGAGALVLCCAPAATTAAVVLFFDEQLVRLFFFFAPRLRVPSFPSPNLLYLARPSTSQPLLVVGLSPGVFCLGKLHVNLRWYHRINGNSGQRVAVISCSIGRCRCSCRL